MWQTHGEKERASTRGRSRQQAETEYETCSNNEWREVSRGHSTKVVANTVGRTELYTIEPIKVFVRDGMAMVVDGHHRYKAFLELGLSRIPIQYIHENQFNLYTAYDTAKKMLEATYK